MCLFNWSTSVFMTLCMKHENDTSDMIGSVQVVRFYRSVNKYNYTNVLRIYCLSLCLSLCLRSLVKTSVKFVKILEQVKTLDCVSGFQWSALDFSQTFASVFTKLWRHGEQFLFLKLQCHFSTVKLYYIIYDYQWYGNNSSSKTKKFYVDTWK